MRAPGGAVAAHRYPSRVTVTEGPADRAAVERRIITVLFADLVGFTPLSERLDSEDVATIQDAYFSMTRETIERYGGVVEKFIGDAVMAVFGIPRGRDDDAERAVRAGLALIGGIEQLGARLGLEAGELQLRVGVNSGEVVHAIDGEGTGRVTGDTVNTAARLQSAARPGAVLLGELTTLTVAEAIETGPVVPVEVKGKADPVRCCGGDRPAAAALARRGARRAPRADAGQGRRDGPAPCGNRGRTTARGRQPAGRPGTAGRGQEPPAQRAGHRHRCTVLRGRVRPQATAPFETVAQLISSAGSTRTSPRHWPMPALRRLAQPSSSARWRASSRARPSPTITAGDLAAEREARFDAWVTAHRRAEPRRRGLADRGRPLGGRRPARLPRSRRSCRRRATGEW